MQSDVQGWRPPSGRRRPVRLPHSRELAQTCGVASASTNRVRMTCLCRAKVVGRLPDSRSCAGLSNSAMTHRSAGCETACRATVCDDRNDITQASPGSPCGVFAARRGVDQKEFRPCAYLLWKHPPVADRSRCWTTPRSSIETQIADGQRTAQTFSVAIDDALRRMAWEPRSIGLVAVTNGPGSFTGLADQRHGCQVLRVRDAAPT